MMLTAAAVLAFAQLADLASVRLCVPNESQQIESHIGFVRADGRVWWSPDNAPDLPRRLFVSADHVTANDRAWYTSREPLTVDGETFVYAEDHQVTVAYNRYNRGRAPIDGVAATVPLGAEGEVILVLTDPIGCWFAEYRLAPG